MPNNPLYGQNKLDKILSTVAKDRRTYLFGAPPVVIDADSTVADGVSGNIIEHHYKDGLQLSVYNNGTQTILIPAANASGMDYGYDQTDDDGVQFVMSQNTHKGHLSGDFIDRFKIGSGTIYARLKLSIADVSGTDDCAFGLRKVEAFQANIDDYDEMACLNVISGDVKIETILNNGATTTTDTTINVADGGTVTLEIFVSLTGAVTYKVNGVAPPTTAAFSFDANEVVTPFFFFLNSTDVAGAVVLQELEVGRQ